MLCQAGLYQNAGASASTSCAVCAPGSYTTGAGVSACFACAPGYYASSNQSTACFACLIGNYASAPGSAGCTGCPAGAGYSVASNATACAACDSSLVWRRAVDHARVHPGIRHGVRRVRGLRARGVPGGRVRRRVAGGAGITCFKPFLKPVLIPVRRAKTRCARPASRVPASTFFPRVAKTIYHRCARHARFARRPCY